MPRRRADAHPKGPPQRHHEKYGNIIDAIYGGKSGDSGRSVIRFQDGTTPAYPHYAPGWLSRPRTHPMAEAANDGATTQRVPVDAPAPFCDGEGCTAGDTNSPR